MAEQEDLEACLKKAAEARAAAKKTEYVWGTCPFDPRYPNTNQTRHCYLSFVDYQRCSRLLGTDYEGCNYFKRCYTSLCPNAWVEKWTQQMEEGTFPRTIYPPAE